MVMTISFGGNLRASTLVGVEQVTGSDGGWWKRRHESSDLDRLSSTKFACT
jgi:hypothetical protein